MMIIKQYYKIFKIYLNYVKCNKNLFKKNKIKLSVLFVQKVYMILKKIKKKFVQLLLLDYVDINLIINVLLVGMIIHVLYADMNIHLLKLIIVMIVIKLINYGYVLHVDIQVVVMIFLCLDIYINIINKLVMHFVNLCLIIKTKLLNYLIKLQDVL